MREQDLRCRDLWSMAMIHQPGVRNAFENNSEKNLFRIKKNGISGPPIASWNS